jgi:mannose-6-phosphate isomerase-like protein (cupin superfamily)
MSDRPAPDGPTLVPCEAAERGVWDGGDDAGRTFDWVYADSDDACQIVFSVPPGGRFLHAGDGFDVYERDIVWRVLTGTLAAANPATGEVQLAHAGESLLFAGDVWLAGWNQGSGPATVVELSAPTRSRAPTVTRRPWPDRPRYARGATEAAATVRRLGERDVVWRLEGEAERMLVGHVVSTRHLTVAEALLPPGRRSSAIVRDVTTTIYVLEGALGVELPDEPSWLEANERDSVLLPPSVPHRLVNLTAGPARALLQLVAREHG